MPTEHVDLRVRELRRYDPDCSRRIGREICALCDAGDVRPLVFVDLRLSAVQTMGEHYGKRISMRVGNALFSA